MSADLRTLLERGSAQLGVELSDDGCMSMLKYLILLKKWNASINLTGSRDDREIVERHLLDSLALLPYVPASARRLIDVGSGAGLPGALLGMFRPDLEVVALEPIRKKHAFLSTLRRELPLPNLQALPMRVETYLDSAEFERFDIAVSRATWPVDEWLERGVQLVGSPGVVLGMEGADERPLPEGASRHPYRIENRTRAVIRLPV